MKRLTSSVRRRTYMKDLPRLAAIPKFLLPGEILMVRKLKMTNPRMGWDEAVEKVVFESVNAADLMSACGGSIGS